MLQKRAVRICGIKFAGGRFQDATRHRRKDGELFDVEISTKIELGAGHIFVFCHDITKRKKTQETLQISKVNPSAILDNAPFLAWLKDTEVRYIMVNKMFADFLRLENLQHILDLPRLKNSKRCWLNV